MPSRQENREICSVMFVFYGTLTCMRTTVLHDIHVGHMWSNDKNDLSASLGNLEFATLQHGFKHALPQKCTIRRLRSVFVRTRKMGDAICACELRFDNA